MYTQVKESGKGREAFATGAVRDTAEGKGRYDLLPTYAIKRLAQHFENGARKYADENWRKGIPLRRFLDSALRHAFNYLEGQRDEDHAAAAAWNILALIETEEMIRRGLLPATLDNLPDWTRPVSERLNPEGQYTADTRLVPVDDATAPRSELEKAIAATPAGQKMFGIDLDACGTTDGVTPIPAPDLTEGFEPYTDDVKMPEHKLEPAGFNYDGDWDYAEGYHRGRMHFYRIEGDTLLLVSYEDGKVSPTVIPSLWAAKDAIDTLQWSRVEGGAI